MKNDGHISTFARLLATENITVVHSHDAETASFDMVNRVLTLPRWKVVDNHLYDMLVGHEVAHALWTDNEMDDEKNCLKACSDIDPENPENAMGFLNIVEDARTSFPVCVETFTRDTHTFTTILICSSCLWINPRWTI